MPLTINKQGYKKTKLGWIPKDWKNDKLSNIVEEDRKISYGIVQTEESVENGVRCIRVLDLKDGKIDYDNLITTSEKISNAYKKTIVRDGDLVIALRGKIGVLGIINAELEGCNLTRGVALLAINKKNSNVFIYHQLSSPKSKIMLESRLSGSALQELSIGVLRKIEVILPPLPEQKKIAQILSTWDNAIEKTKALLKKKEKLKKGLMQGLLTGKVRFEEFRKEEGYKKTKLGAIPKDWEVKKLGEVCEIIMGQSPDSSSYNSKKIGMPLIQGNADIQNRISNPRNWTTETTKECTIGDLILTVRAPVGAVAKSIHNACIGRGVCSIRNNKKSNMEFIYQFLLDYETKWGSLEQGSTFTAVSGIEIKKLKISLPPLLEQKKIAQILSTCDQEIDNLTQQLSKLQEQKKGLMQVLLTGAVRVDVVGF